MAEKMRQLTKKKNYRITETKENTKQEGHFLLPLLIGGLFGGMLIYFKKIPFSLGTQALAIHTVFTSIVLQAFPFMLIGVLISSFMHVFIPDEWVVRIFPKKFGIGFLTAMFAGLFFPICECAIVPVMYRLVKKGVPMPVAVTFMLSAPIINPIVILSTWYAFPEQPQITVLRVYFGLVIAFIVGLAMSVYGKELPIFLEHDCDEISCHCGHSHSHDCGCNMHNHEHSKAKHLLEKCKMMFLHAADEFFDVGKYLVVGALIASCIQQLLPSDFFVRLQGFESFSLLFMMLAAFLFSACSTSDAFIARGFTNRFPTGAIMGFLVFGPMMDIKNLCMLLSHFKRGFVVRLCLLIVVLNILMLTILTMLYL